MTTNGPWKPFVLGVLSTSLTCIAIIWVWNCDVVLKNQEHDSVEDSSTDSSLHPKFISKQSSHETSLSKADTDTLPKNNQNRKSGSHNFSIWNNMKDISRIIKRTSKVSMDHSLQRWKWESIRKQIRRKTSSTQRLWEAVLNSAAFYKLSSSLEHVPTFDSLTNSVFHYPYENNMDDNGHDSNLGTSSSDEDNIWNANIHSTVSAEEKSGLCIGSIFGLDVGGTLAKLVYFEKHPIHSSCNNECIRQESDNLNIGMKPETPRRKIQSKISSHDSHSNEDLTKLVRARQSSMPEALLHFNHDEKLQGYTEKMRKSRSMFNLVDGDERDMVLTKFYTFANNLDSYATGVKENDLSFYSRALGGDFHFIQFETRRMQAALELIRISSFHRNILHIGATGGGAHRFSNEFEQVLGINMVKQDELDSMVAGLQFALRDCPNECYTFVPDEEAMTQTASGSEESLLRELESSSVEQEHSPVSTLRQRRLEDTDQYWWSKKVLRENSSTAKQYPYLVVMIGTGVSILRVDGPRKHERISGSTIGGGTYWGLCRLLTDAENFQSALELAKLGDATKVDMLVGDIYGPNSGALDKLGLTANIVASSFGKLVSKQNPAEGLNQMDLARALLLMVTNNIGQVALLNAKLHNTQRIFFIGNFLRHNIISQQRLAFSLAFWSQGEMEALFLEHEGYFGSLGAFLLSQGMNSSKLPASLLTQSRKELRSHRELNKSKRTRARSL